MDNEDHFGISLPLRNEPKVWFKSVSENHIVIFILLLYMTACRCNWFLSGSKHSLLPYVTRNLWHVSKRAGTAATLLPQWPLLFGQ